MYKKLNTKSDADFVKKDHDHENELRVLWKVKLDGKRSRLISNGESRFKQSKMSQMARKINTYCLKFN